MTAEYEKSLLNLLMHDVSFKRDLQSIPTDLFTSPVNKQIMDLLKMYVQQFDQLPHEVNLIEYWRTLASTAQHAVDGTFLHQTINAITDAYSYTAYEPTQVKETISGEVIRAKLRAIMIDMSKPVNTAISLELPTVLKEFSTRIALMGTSDEKIKSAGYLNARPLPDKDSMPTVFPCFLSGINRIRARGGFHSPNSVVLLGGPKSFKTTFLVCFAMQYAGGGLNVYYADAENGHISIEDRCRQHANNMTMAELYDPNLSNTVQARMSAWWAQGGSIRVDSYLKGRCTMTDVKYRLEELRAVDGWVPHLVIFDYLDEWIPSSTYDRRADRRLQIQNVYNEADALMNEKNLFYFTVSPKNREGGVGEDYKKLYNCWSAFELVQNEYEEQNNIIRMVSLGQREGSKNDFLAVEVDPERQQIRQLNREQWLYHVEAMKQSGIYVEGKKGKKGKP